MLEISVYTNIHGHRNYGLVLRHGNSGMVELLLDPFTEFAGASAEARKARLRWVTPVAADHPGPGTRVLPYTGQPIAWQTPEIREIIATGPQAIADRRAELERKFSGGTYN